MDLKERVENYHRTFREWEPPYVGEDGRVYGIWILGQDYRNKMGFYGQYPPNYLRRVGALFPEIFTLQCLHIFSGSLTPKDVGTAFRLDASDKYKPDFAGNFLEFDSIMRFDVICADPPYTGEDALHYGVPMLNRNDAIKKCYDLLEPKGYILWLDQVMPMWSKEQFSLKGLIGVSRSSNHRFRNLVIYQKVG
jgi:hypothetical protein